MDMLELPVIKGSAASITSMATLFMAAVAYSLQAVHNAPAGTTFGILIRSLIVAAFAWLVAAIGVDILAIKRTYLLASHPPTFITEKTWFWKLRRTKKQVLDGAAWVRVISQNPEYASPLRVEIGTRGYITTMIHVRRYSENDISICKDICSQVAQFLKIENRGYIYYDDNGVPHTG